MAKSRRKDRHETGEINPTYFSPNSACYSPKRDGPLGKFLAEIGHGTFPLFQGLKDFEMLQKEGWLAPRMSMIRLMWNVGRDDEHFEVTEDFKLEGIIANAHSGKPGIHEPAKIFENAPPFEAHRLWGPAHERMVAERETEARRRYEQLLREDN
jgi:hypothetical protein